MKVPGTGENGVPDMTSAGKGKYGMGSLGMAKRLTAVLLIFLLTLAFATCSAKEKDDGTAEGSRTSTTGTKDSRDEATGTADRAEDASETARPDESGGPATEDGAKEAMEAGLSMGYRTDVVPVYKDSAVTRSWEDHSIPESPVS